MSYQDFITKTINEIDEAETLNLWEKDAIKRGMEMAIPEIERLRAVLSDAINLIEDWGGYATDYFQEKNKLVDDIAKLNAALNPVVK
jgi:hypothetical protein